MRWSRRRSWRCAATAAWGRHGSRPILGMAPSTVHRVLTRHGMPRLAWLDRPTGRADPPLRTRPPGELVHVDVKKIGRLRAGGGWRVHGRDSLERRRSAPRPRVGYEYVHAAIDDHTRLAYAEIHPDERAETCAGFLRRAAAWFAAHGITIERVMTDNALAYRRSRAWREALGRARRRATVHPPLPPPDQRQSRTLQPHHAARSGLYAQPFELR